jgi:hypothetical protein
MAGEIGDLAESSGDQPRGRAMAFYFGTRWLLVRAMETIRNEID